MQNLTKKRIVPRLVVAKARGRRENPLPCIPPWTRPKKTLPVRKKHVKRTWRSAKVHRARSLTPRRNRRVIDIAMEERPCFLAQPVFGDRLGG